MPKLSLFKPVFMRRTLANRKRRAQRRHYVPTRRTYRARVHRPILKKQVFQIQKGFLDTATLNVTGTPAAHNFNTTIKLSDLGEAANFAPLFQWYRIQRVKVEIVSPFNINQDGVGQQSSLTCYTKKEEVPGETTPASENAWGEIRAKKRHLFGMGGRRTLKFYYKPHTWENPSGLSYRKQFDQWQTTTTQGRGVDYGGLVGTLLPSGFRNMDSSDSMKMYVTLYIQFKGSQ